MSEALRPEDMRVSDVERGQVQRRLQFAHEIGQIDLGEFDERVRTVWSARTRGELVAQVADLPVPAPPPPPTPRGVVFSRSAGGVAMQVLTIVWVAVTMLNVAVWGVLSVTLGDAVYPWWLWVAVPPGAVLATLYAAGIGRPRRR